MSGTEYHAASVPLRSSDAGADPEDPYADNRCGLKKHKNSALIALGLFLVGGFAFVIWSAVHGGKSSGGSDPASKLAPYTLDTMFNSSLAPKSASLAWLGSSALDSDQFISVINGSFYLTTLPNYADKTLLIDAADLAPFAPLTPPVQPSQLNSGARPLMSQAPAVDADTASLYTDVDTTRRSRRLSGQQVRSQAHSVQLDPTQPLRSSGDVGDVSATAQFTYKSFDLSPDQTSMLFGVNCQQLYRHSSFCTYLVYNIQSKSMRALSNSAPLRTALWSPSSSRLAYVLNDDIYIEDLSAPEGTPALRVTSDGEWDVTINGVMDWVYEEEVYSATTAMWWAPDGQSLAFLHFNQSAVPTYAFDFYTSPYNQPFSYKYPKPGAPNSIVEVRSYNLSSNAVRLYPELRTAFPEYEYVINVQYFDSATLLVRLQNREQNLWQLYRVNMDASAGATSAVVPLSSARAQWYYEPHNCLTSLSPLPFYVDLVNTDSGEGPDGGVGRGDHVHLAAFSIADGTLHSFITSGEFDVLTLDAVVVDTAAQDAFVYYTREVASTAANLAAPTLWRTHLNTRSNGSDSVQLLPPSSKDELTWQSGSYSPSGSFVLVQDSAAPPRSTLYALNLTSSSAALTPLAVLADNSALYASMQSTYALPSTTFLELDSTLPGLKLSASILAPAGFDITKCTGAPRKPVLLFAYGGPGSQQVTTSYKLGYASQTAFMSALVSSGDFIVLTVDPVGTAGKGEAYRKGHTYLRLGVQERSDMLAAAQWVGEQCWADGGRISYWGWSYGGFLTSFTAAAGSGLFKHLISVAPVTSWALYDSIYTERYMLTPESNPVGYANSSVIAAASPQFDARAWHLFGGTADDNVHFQNSALLVDQLINLDMPINTFYFPNRAHSLTQWHTGAPPRYLYKRLTELLTGAGGPNGNGQMKQQ